MSKRRAIAILASDTVQKVTILGVLKKDVELGRVVKSRSIVGDECTELLEVLE